MKQYKRLIACVIEILLGVALMCLGFTGVLDEFWSGMGTALLLVGIIFLVRQIRYRTNEAYRETVDVEVNDERNKYISMKAWSWAGYLFVLIAAFSAILFKILGNDDYVHLASGSVCLIMLLYWISYMLLRRKY